MAKILTDLISSDSDIKIDHRSKRSSLGNLSSPLRGYCYKSCHSGEHQATFLLQCCGFLIQNLEACILVQLCTADPSST